MINTNDQSRERAQSIVILAIAIVGLVALMALVIDGGMLYYYRRQAQTAADAGALAGARELCEGELKPGIEVIAKAAAINYAVNLNNADQVDPEPEIDMNNGLVTVNTKITRSTFFASTVGFPQAEVQAVATAGCYPGNLGERVLPISWACKGSTSTSPHATSTPGPTPTPDPDSDIEECALDYLTLVELQEYQDIFPTLDDFHHWDLSTGTIPGDLLSSSPPKFGAPQGQTFPRELYVIMDSENSMTDMATICIDNIWGLPGELQCDIDGDGINDFLSSGTRSWLSLFEGSQSTADLLDWIENGPPETIKTHRWYPAFQGDPAVIYATLRELEGQTFVIPVYNGFCEGDPIDAHPECLNIVHHLGAPDDTSEHGGDSRLHYHVSGFASFYISCVRSPGKPCPGANWYAAERPCLLAPNNCSPGNNFKSIEGYFLSGISTEVGGTGGGIDYGTYVLRLIK